MAALENVLVWADRVLLPAISSEGFVCVCFLFVCLICVFLFFIALHEQNPMILARFYADHRKVPNRPQNV